uniref:endonuclease domain-containing protein n=1 Tax=uncultured Sphingomonas sp. TaxID=158754 RepID=UPI0035CAA6D4
MLRPEVAVARKLRRDLSLPEALLWQRLRGKQAGLKFRRQHPVGPYVVDLYCPAVKMAIEIDGDAHDRADRPARDAERDAFIAENGLRIVPVSAQRVLTDPDAAADAIVAYVARPLHHSPEVANGPPPRAGGIKEDIWISSRSFRSS